jgi:hypothetical protein
LKKTQRNTATKLTIVLRDDHAASPQEGAQRVFKHDTKPAWAIKGAALGKPFLSNNRQFPE